MVRHLTRPYFLEPCGSKMLLWRCYNTKEASWFRSKVPKMILAETDVEDFNTFTGYAVSFKHMLWTCFKVISQNCEKGFTIFLCNSWSLLDFRHFFLILLSWLRNHVQSSLRVGVLGGSIGASSFGWFLGGFGFCWLRGTLDSFRWFAVLVVSSILQHTEILTLYCTHGRTWLTEVIRFFYSK